MFDTLYDDYTITVSRIEKKNVDVIDNLIYMYVLYTMLIKPKI